MKKLILSLALALILCFSFTRPTFAQTTLSDGNFNYTVDYTVEGGAATLIKYTGTETNVIIPSKVGKGIPVVAIASGTFTPDDATWYNSSNKTLESVTIPDSVVEIGDSAFISCTKLKSVNLPKKLKKIGERAFAFCESLTTVNIPGSVKKISAGAFEYCTNLTSVSIGDGVEIIDGAPDGNGTAGAFENCTSLSSINIPSSVKGIGMAAFSRCESLKSVTLHNGLESIGKYAFARSAITSITIPNTVKSIENSAFYVCEELVSVTLSDNLTRISPYLFFHCSSLNSIKIPSKVASISEFAFMYCTNLTSIVIPAKVKTVERGAFMKCEKLSSLTLENGIVNIQGGIDVERGGKRERFGAFSGCKSLSSVTIPGSVKSIGDYAFSDCESLEKVTIRSAVSGQPPISIGTYAFAQCSSLSKAYIPKRANDISTTVFDGLEGMGILTIYGDNSSSAQTYAQNSNMLFKVAKPKLEAEKSPTISVTIKGTAKVGKILTAKVTPSSTKLSYQWFADGVSIKKATKPTFKVTSTQIGKTITVKVTGTVKGGKTGSAKSKGVKGMK